ncbi:MAG: hypothetical protein NTW35_01115 [Candidatus Nomurabacteria bacterium]|nr:hypothetical protein [Candidatus Nomurabacteria bacterium]
MQVTNFLSEKKSIIIEITILCVFLGALYYGYTLISEQTPVTTENTSQQLYGPNFTMLFKVINEDRVVLGPLSFMDSSIARQLEDFSEVISPNPVRGRENPFAPYR